MRGLFAALDGDRALAESLVEGFLSSAEVYLHNLARSIDAGDAPTATRQCHSLKGSAANMRGVALAAEAGRCELLCKSSSLVEAGTCLPKMRFELDRLTRALEVLRIPSAS
jgi:HPt (histidine-containing phosphotransfer) domain-containing protein